ncbi:pyridoxal phosphate-dependent aminotransferase, partial [Thalassospira xiamenensis]
MSAPTPRPGILDIAPYVGGKSRTDGATRVIKLSSNEGALGPSPKAIEALRKSAEKLHRYPDGGCEALRNKLAEKYNLEADQIVCGAGSDELITLLIRAYAGPGDEVLYSQHGFLMYPIAAKGVGAVPVTAAETNMTTSVDALLAAVTEKTKIVFVANPNNPTGTYINDAEMKRLRDGLREDIVLVVDAAYAEFMTGQEDYSAGEELVRAGKNTVMTRTFSKIYGLGGIRLGWCYAPVDIADVL